MVILTALRAKVLKLLHQGHPGIQQMKSLMHKYAYWPDMDHDIEEIVRLCGPCAAAAAASKGNTALVASSNKTLGAHSHRLRWSTSGNALPHRYGRLFKVPRCYLCPARHPGRQWQYFINCAPSMVFQRQSSATTGRSLPHTSSGSSVRLMLSVRFCHHRTAPNQTDGPNALSTPSSAAS